MNGGMTECGRCDCDPCCCKEIEERKQEQRVKDGKEALEVSWGVFTKGPKGWKRKIIQWLWPDLCRMADAIKEYYWSQ